MSRPELKSVEFSTDAAIESSAEDLLGRTEFAASLADAIAKTAAEHSIVIAVNGGWGTGKSSIKNMVVEYLRKREVAKIVEFNPWDFSGEKELAEGFFHDLGLALGVHQPGGAETRRVAAWNVLATRLSGGASAVKTVGKVLGLAGVPLAESIGNTVSDALKQSGKLSEQAKKALEEEAKLEKKTLLELKNELRTNLPHLKKPLLVVIDDIDRLASDEVCLLFRMVKANADFPRVIFLLLFDKPQVVRALGEIATGHGEAFLEKIVQVSFDVPDLAPHEIAAFADKEFNKLMKRMRLKLPSAEQKRWDAAQSDLQTYFTTLRAVRRFMNSLSFHFSLFRTTGGVEVNVVDLTVLEMLRVFENDLYRRMPRMRPLLLGESPYWPGLDHQKQQAQEQFRKLLEKVADERRDVIATSLRRTFPHIATEDGIDTSQVTIGSRRVAHPNMFGTYFRLALAEKAIPQAELIRIRRAATDYARFNRAVRKYMARAQFDILLEHLWDYTGELSRTQPL